MIRLAIIITSVFVASGLYLAFCLWMESAPAAPDETPDDPDNVVQLHRYCTGYTWRGVLYHDDPVAMCPVHQVGHK